MDQDSPQRKQQGIACAAASRQLYRGVSYGFNGLG
jgi:hypothetical protein